MTRPVEVGDEVVIAEIVFEVANVRQVSYHPLGDDRRVHLEVDLVEVPS